MDSVLPSIEISFKHPGYYDDYDQNILIRLRGFDKFKEGIAGLHQGTALTACGILSGRWDGFFSKDRNGARLDVDLDGLLTEDSYYYCIEDDDKYAIYPSFEHWAFPHRQLPVPWNRSAPSTRAPVVSTAVSNATNAILRRDGNCRMTGQRDYMEKAHICPRSELAWFRENNMSQYNTNSMLSPEFATDDVSNAIALRSDIHKAFDDRTFTVVAMGDKWAAHFFTPTYDLGKQYHGCTLDIDETVSPNQLFARFAWTVFPLVRGFLQTGPKRWLRVKVIEEGGFKEDKQYLDAKTITSRFMTSRTRSQSPTKRKAMADETQEDSNIYQSQKRRGEASDDPREECGIHQSNKRRRKARAVEDLSTHMEAWSTEKPKLGDTEALPSHSSHGYSEKFVDSAIGLGKEPDCQLSGEEKLDKYIQGLRRREILKRRPNDASLYCCDYAKAEKTARLEAIGVEDCEAVKLCNQCLGQEALPMDRKDF